MISLAMKQTQKTFLGPLRKLWKFFLILLKPNTYFCDQWLELFGFLNKILKRFVTEKKELGNITNY